MTQYIPTPYTISGPHLVSGNGLDNNFNYPTTAAENGVTATASGTQANSYLITTPLTRITTVTTAADGVLLPPSKAGKTFVVINSGGNSMTVFASGSDTINGTAGATGVAQANNAVTIYYCPAPGIWFSK